MESRQGIERQPLGRVSAAGLAVCLKGIDFPAKKHDIIANATSTGCSDRAVQLLDKLPDREYNRPTEVEQEFGKMRR